MHQEHRTWFPFILIGLTVLILVVYVVWGESSNLDQEDSQTRIAEVQEAAPSDEEYQAEIIRILEDLQVSQSPGQTYDELLIVKVPAKYKEAHLELVIAIGELRANKIESGEARLDLLRGQIDWLP